MIEEKTTIIPGEKIAASEEILPGYGTFDGGESIRGAITGRFFIDKEKMLARIEPIASMPVILKKGDAVICEVKIIMGSIVIAEIIHVAGKKRDIAGGKDASIHISNLSKEYVEEIGKEYRIGDILRAKVIQVKPSLQLSTIGREFGVIKSFCMRCRHPLKKKGNKLECEECERTETRKTAMDYGEGNMDLIIGG